MDTSEHPGGNQLEQLLSKLSEDVDEAAASYEDLRQRLIRSFRLRGVADSETATDETIDRVIRKQNDGMSPDDIVRYAFGVARKVALEHHRRERAEGEAILEMERMGHTVDLSGDEGMLDRLTACLDQMDDASRRLVLDYYDLGSKSLTDREDLAKRNGLSLNGLRLRIHRLKKLLKKCVDQKNIRLS